MVYQYTEIFFILKHFSFMQKHHEYNDNIDLC